MRDFPADFLWGSSTAAHQVEGGNVNNDWWDWEHASGSPASEPSGDGIDHYHRYDGDFALLSSLGQGAHRISVEWSRIEPAEGEFSLAALDHYRRVVESMRRHGLVPFVTLHHFTLPRWFARQGGWTSNQSVEVFGRYCHFVGAGLGDLVDYFCTLNEPQMVALQGYATGEFPPGVSDWSLADHVNSVLMAAHRRAVAALRSVAGAPRVGVCLQMAPIGPCRPGDPGDEEASDFVNRLVVGSHLEDLRAGGDVGDWVGLQYYTRVRVDRRVPTLIVPWDGRLPATQMGWEIHPSGLGEMLRKVSTVGLPIVVTENGIATADDTERVAYLSSHLRVVAQALKDGVDVRGYLYWSAFDNFEWNKGYAPTFGLVAIDRHDGLRRVPRPSAVAFGRLAETGSLSELEPVAAGGVAVR